MGCGAYGGGDHGSACSESLRGDHAEAFPPARHAHQPGPAGTTRRPRWGALRQRRSALTPRRSASASSSVTVGAVAHDDDARVARARIHQRQCLNQHIEALLGHETAEGDNGPAGWRGRCWPEPVSSHGHGDNLQYRSGTPSSWLGTRRGMQAATSLQSATTPSAAGPRRPSPRRLRGAVPGVPAIDGWHWW